MKIFHSTSSCLNFFSFPVPHKYNLQRTRSYLKHGIFYALHNRKDAEISMEAMGSMAAYQIAPTIAPRRRRSLRWLASFAYLPTTTQTIEEEHGCSGAG
jgi:hypothetical protein